MTTKVGALSPGRSWIVRTGIARGVQRLGERMSPLNDVVKCTVGGKYFARMVGTIEIDRTKRTLNPATQAWNIITPTFRLGSVSRSISDVKSNGGWGDDYQIIIDNQPGLKMMNIRTNGVDIISGSEGVKNLLRSAGVTKVMIRFEAPDYEIAELLMAPCERDIDELAELFPGAVTFIDTK